MKIQLHRIEEVDLIQLRSWRNDFRVYNWCRQFCHIDESSHRKWFENQSSNKSIEMFSILENGTLKGVCGLTDIDYINSRAEFSLYIGPEFQKNSYAYLALNALLDMGFNKFNLNTIWGECFEGNPAMRLFEKFNFIKEGVRRDFYFRDGKYINAHLISLNRDAYKNFLNA